MSNIIKIESIPYLTALNNARRLFRTSKYVEALVEYKKLMYVRDCADEIFSSIIQCLSYLEDFEKFLKTFRSVDQENIITYISLQTNPQAKEKFLDKVCIENEDTNDFSLLKYTTPQKPTIDKESMKKKWCRTNVNELLNDNLFAKLLEDTKNCFVPIHYDLLSKILVSLDFDSMKKQSTLEVLKCVDVRKEVEYRNDFGQTVIINLERQELIRDSAFVIDVIDTLIDVIENDYIIDNQVIKYVCMDHFCKHFPKPLIDDRLHMAYLYYRILLCVGVKVEIKFVSKKFDVEYDKLRNFIIN